jgi:N-acetylneuraminic acid mutarotase
VKLLSTALSVLSRNITPPLSPKQSRILVIGGCTGNGGSSQVYQLGLDSGLPWAKLSVMPEQVDCCPALYVADKIHTGDSLSLVASGHEIGSKGVLGLWHDEDAKLACSRFEYVAVECRGKIYGIGGYDAEQSDRKMPTECRKHDDEAWESTLPPMSTQRRSACAVALDDKIFVFGGYCSVTQEALRSAECFDVTTKVWSPIADLPAARDEAAAIVDRTTGRMFVLGGDDAEGQVVNSVFEYMRATNTWVEASWTLPAPRKNFAAHLVDGKLVVIGGHNKSGSALSSCIFTQFDDPACGEHWESLPSLPVPLFAFGSVALPGTGTSGGR